MMYIEPIIVTTDSLPFVNIIPLLENATCVISPKCNLHTLSYESELPTTMEHVPNPVNNTAEIRFSLKEKATYTLALYGSDGAYVKSIAQSSLSSEKGDYMHLWMFPIFQMEHISMFSIQEHSGLYAKCM